MKQTHIIETWQGSVPVQGAKYFIHTVDVCVQIRRLWQQLAEVGAHL